VGSFANATASSLFQLVGICARSDAQMFATVAAVQWSVNAEFVRFTDVNAS
jgi:hypothetical protein